LRDRVLELAELEREPSATKAPGDAGRRSELVSALVNLQTPRPTAERVAEEVVKDRGAEAPIEELVRAALQRLARGARQEEGAAPSRKGRPPRRAAPRTACARARGPRGSGRTASARTSPSSSSPPAAAASRSITCSSTARPASARPRSRGSWRAR